MSAEIPWTVGPGESLKPAPPLPRTALEPEEPRAAEAVEGAPRYTQAQYESERLAFAEAFSHAMRTRLEGERDRALLDLQQARAAVVYWQARADGK